MEDKRKAQDLMEQGKYLTNLGTNEKASIVAKTKLALEAFEGVKDNDELLLLLIARLGDE